MSNFRTNIFVVIWCGVGLAGIFGFDLRPPTVPDDWWYLVISGWWAISMAAGFYFSSVIERGLKKFVEDTVDEVLRNRDGTN